MTIRSKIFKKITGALRQVDNQTNKNWGTNSFRCFRADISLPAFDLKTKLRGEVEREEERTN